MTAIRFASWNVNSLKVRLPHLLQWLKTCDDRLEPIDLIGLQELKMTDDKFPIEDLEKAGFLSLFMGQKTYNGVAILVRKSALTIRVICAYFPNGQAPGTEKFFYKLQWLSALKVFLVSELQKYPRLILMGDFNIAPQDEDVHDPAKWVGQNLVSPEERAFFKDFQDLGLIDSFRLFDQEAKSFSWWDYRMMGFRRNAGMRIDHVMVSQALKEACTACLVDKAPRKWEQPSDHAPVILSLRK